MTAADFPPPSAWQRATAPSCPTCRSTGAPGRYVSVSGAAKVCLDGWHRTDSAWTREGEPDVPVADDPDRCPGRGCWHARCLHEKAQARELEYLRADLARAVALLRDLAAAVGGSSASWWETPTDIRGALKRARAFLADFPAPAPSEVATNG